MIFLLTFLSSVPWIVYNWLNSLGATLNVPSINQSSEFAKYLKLSIVAKIIVLELLPLSSYSKKSVPFLVTRNSGSIVSSLKLFGSFSMGLSLRRYRVTDSDNCVTLGNFARTEAWALIIALPIICLGGFCDSKAFTLISARMRLASMTELSGRCEWLSVQLTIVSSRVVARAGQPVLWYLIYHKLNNRRSYDHSNFLDLLDALPVLAAFLLFVYFEHISIVT